MTWHNTRFSAEDVQRICDTRTVFKVTPGAEMDLREGKTKVVAFLGDDGQHLELFVPFALFGHYVRHEEGHIPGTSEVFRFSIGYGLALGTGPIVRVCEDNDGRIYVCLPTDPEAKPFIHFLVQETSAE